MPSTDGAHIACCAVRIAAPKRCRDCRLGGSPAVGQSIKPEMVASEHNKIERKAPFGPDQAWRGWQRQNATAKVEPAAAGARSGGQAAHERQTGERRCR